MAVTEMGTRLWIPAALTLVCFVACGGDDASGGGGKAGSGGAAGQAGMADGSAGMAGSAGLDAGGGAAGADASDLDAGDLDAADADAAPACQIGEYHCTADTLEVCNSTQSGFDFAQACGPGLCSAIAKKCLECVSPANCPATGTTCTIATCLGNVCGTTPAGAGTACGTNGVCNGAGVCGTCVPTATQCNGNTTEICSSAGQWTTGTSCPFVCLSGQCAGVCAPGTKQCNNNTSQICDVVGQWTSLTQCTATTPSCHDGECEPPTPSSCSALNGSCGPSGQSYCCATKLVNGGIFSRSYDVVNYTDPSYTAAISDYRLDVYEVSVGRFRQFVLAGKGTQASPPAAGSGAHPTVPASGWNSSWNGNLASDTPTMMLNLACNPTYATWTNAAGANESRPINCVSWYDAFAFCAWDGARLPTEAEWNYAAAGGSEQRVYPWSIPPTASYADGTYASYYLDGISQCMGNGVAGCTIDDLVPVGSKTLGRGRYGQYELSGNVWEWVLDVYTNPYALNPCTDCAVLSGSSARVIRGGSFFGNPGTITASNRNFATPTQRFFSTGLRCARAK